LENVDYVTSIRRKEPWLAVSLSWILPGLGQFYTKNYCIAAVFLLVYIGSCIALYASILSLNVFYIWAVVFCSVSLFVIRLASCFIAFGYCKRLNSQFLQINDGSDKDAWLSSFLSFLFPGLGHIYLQKRFLCVIYVLLYFGIKHLPIGDFYISLMSKGLRLVSAVHAYLIGRRFDFSDIRSMVVSWSTIISAIVLFWIIAPLITSRYIVEGNTYTLGLSMFPTLKNNSRVIINRMTIRFNEPKIGDVIIFEQPFSKKYAEEHPKDNPPFLCKRIVAVEKEQVLIKGNDLYINGKKRVFETYDVNASEYDRLKGNNTFYSDKNCGIGKPFVVPDNCYYVLGDNRSNSLDSRYFGPVPKKFIMGKVIKVYWPLSEMRILSTKWEDVNIPPL
jgi:signal peptidase I